MEAMDSALVNRLAINENINRLEFGTLPPGHQSLLSVKSQYPTMHFLPTFVSALSCLSFATQILASPHKAGPVPLSKTFIMKQTMDYSKGALPIYGPDGTIIYHFMRNIHDPITGYTTVMLMNPNSDVLFVLRSVSANC
jgi:hypothetical protein